MESQLPTLVGARVELRWLTEADLPMLLQIFGDPEVVRFMGIPLLRSLDDAQALLDDIHQSFKSRALFQWGVALRESGEIIGSCTLAELDWDNKRGELGFALGSAHQGKGLMTEALGLLLDHSFDTLQLHRLEADVDPSNQPSLALLQRFGFAREGFMKERHLVAGEWQDTVFFGLLAANWRS